MRANEIIHSRDIGVVIMTYLAAKLIILCYLLFAWNVCLCVYHDVHMRTYIFITFCPNVRGQCSHGKVEIQFDVEQQFLWSFMKFDEFPQVQNIGLLRLK